MLARRGWFILIGSGVAYVCAAALHYPELGVLAAAGLVAVAVGMAWVVRRPHLAITRIVEPTRVTRGEVSLGRLTVLNEGRIAVSETIGEEHCGTRVLAVRIPRLESRGTDHTTYRLPTDRRAVFDVGPLTAVRQDPFGLCRRAQRLGSVERVWVYPKVHKLASLPVGRTRSLDGPDLDLLPHGSITFHALREYVPGDDLRHIHWKSYARTGSLMVREHVDTSLPQVTLLIDTLTQAYSSEDFEEAVEVAASIVAAVVEARLPLRLITTGGESAQGRGAAGDNQLMFDLLAGLDLSEHGDLRSLANKLVADRRGDVLFAVVGTPSNDSLVALGSLCGRYNRGLLVAVGESALDLEIPAPRHIAVGRVRKAKEFPSVWEQALGR